jgi:hypothetical protein
MITQPTETGRKRPTRDVVPTSAGSIYIGLLEAVLGERESSPRLSASQALAEVVRCRRTVIWRRLPPDDEDWAAAALADQTAYDSALICYARRVGIDCDPGRFGTPGVERARIEGMLEARGIPLGP